MPMCKQVSESKSHDFSSRYVMILLNSKNFRILKFYVSKLQDPEVLMHNNGAEIQNFRDYVALNFLKGSYQKFNPPKMSAFERFISPENLMAPTLLVFSEKSINS